MVAGRPKLTVTELKQRQRDAGWFLPPDAEGDPESPTEYDPTLTVNENELLAYDYFLNLLKTVPHGLTTIEGPMLKELAEAHILYLRCKDKIDSDDLEKSDTKRTTLIGLFKWAHSRRQYCFKQLGFEPESRKSIKTTGIPKHRAAFRDGDTKELSNDDLFDISDIELAEAGSQNGPSRN